MEMTKQFLLTCIFQCNEFFDECECSLEDITLLEDANLDPSDLFLPTVPPDPALQVCICVVRTLRVFFGVLFVSASKQNN